MPTAPPKHNPKGNTENKAWQRDGGTTTQRGYGASWRRTRLVIIHRDNALCQVCYKMDRVTPFDQVDHIVPKAKGGTNSHDNLQCICDTCHKHKTATQDSKR